ncbi:MAG: folylpolyglutamate synthase/dihydrofolate synthase family protein [Peptococcaceae bacterium]|nr:folylpolyglutamate synthase/dihydrofolate synthase family protein [Peptococcaceae bacterium]
MERAKQKLSQRQAGPQTGSEEGLAGEDRSKERLAFEETLARVSSFGIKPGLLVIRALLEELGNPQAGLKAIHITGTNGKGSVSAMLESVLRRSGYRTGLFTSPHLISYRERFRVNGQMAEYGVLLELLAETAAAARQVAEKTGSRPTEFELLTAVGFLYFRRMQTQVLILEVGMGGRYDSTNVIPDPLLTIITNVTLDHENFLGHSVKEIAWEKAGIIKEGVPLIWAGKDAGALAVIEEVRQQAKGGPICDAAKECVWQSRPLGLLGQEIDIVTPEGTYPAVRLPLNGPYQGVNLAAVLRALEVLRPKLPGISRESIYRGLAAVRWPCRLELVQQLPAVILDGSHNPDGIRWLAQWLKEQKPAFDRVILVMGMVADKDRLTAARYLDGLAESVIITKPLSSRAGSWEELARGFQQNAGTGVLLEEDCHKALERALGQANPKDLVLCTGSFYLVGELRKNWKTGDMF